MTIRFDLTGLRFGRLIVNKIVGRNRHSQPIWLCICDCGGENIITSGDLKSGHTKSCGCLRIETARVPKKHGKAKSIEYRIWTGMLNRCRNPNVQAYPSYGGRGITVCGRWIYGENGQSGFECFLTDIGYRPSPKHQIDRIDPWGNYEPANCRWLIGNKQANTRRNTRIVKFYGKEMPLTEAVRIAGNVIHYESAATRIYKCGWSVERAVETPPNPKHTRVKKSIEAAVNASMDREDAA